MARPKRTGSVNCRPSSVGIRPSARRSQPLFLSRDVGVPYLFGAPRALASSEPIGERGRLARRRTPICYLQAVLG